MHRKKISLRPFAIGIVASVAIFIAGCSVTLVAPYDETLVASSEEFYKNAARIIEEGRAASPKTDDARAKITEPNKHSAHYSKFESKYNQLVIDAEALILRAMASSDKIDLAGQELQSKLNELIETPLPSKCQELKYIFGKTSLTAANYIDLKCILTNWKKQHSDPKLTQNTLILKKANWEGRKQVIFNAILAIQKAERFKKTEESK